ncbi:hypothetical protein BKA70DRAFT_1339782 [Coprinopsis sp. MPI-PUGE-AT-0042]|nr:hypothetical protein BKA70DRAFT_1339782 [Coprinopsis sp. MPI-PUGE-AT-0042]
MPKAEVKTESGIVPKVENGVAMEVEDTKMKVDEGSPNQRLSSRLKKKETPDWSFLRGKKRGADVLDSDVKFEVSEKKPKTNSKREKTEVKEEASLATSVRLEGDRKPQSRKQAAVKVKRQLKHEQLSRVKDKLMKKDETIEPSQPESSRQGGERDGKPMVTVAEGSQRSTSGKTKSSRPKRSSRKSTAAKKESPVDALLPTTVKKEESVEPKVEVKIEVKKAKKEQGLPALELDLTARFKAAGISQLPLAIPDYTDAIHGVKSLELPGAPGVWINIAGGRQDELMRVFCAYEGTASPPLWWYMGQYELRDSQALTKEEWGVQDEQRAWAEGIELGRTPTSEEINGYLESKVFAESVTAADVLRALDRGDEGKLALTLNLFTMKCVAYDDGFQRDVAQKYPGWLLTHPPGQ